MMPILYARLDPAQAEKLRQAGDARRARQQGAKADGRARIG